MRSYPVELHRMLFQEDEPVRPDEAAEKGAPFKPVVRKAGLSVAGNSSGINRGAAKVLHIRGQGMAAVLERPSKAA
jgi:acetyl-CoA acetyltransferase